MNVVDLITATSVPTWWENEVSSAYAVMFASYHFGRFCNRVAVLGLNNTLIYVLLYQGKELPVQSVADNFNITTVEDLNPFKDGW